MRQSTDKGVEGIQMETFTSDACYGQIIYHVSCVSGNCRVNVTDPSNFTNGTYWSIKSYKAVVFCFTIKITPEITLT